MTTQPLAEWVTQTRALAGRPCPDHPDQPSTTDALRCPHCAGTWRANGNGDAMRRNAVLRAMAACDERFPRRWVDALPEHRDVLGWVERVHADPSRAPSLLLFGDTGVGKTWHAYAALRAALAGQPGASWAHGGFADFLAALRPRAGLDSEAEMARYRGADLLLLDDLGTAKGSEWVEEITHRLVNGRYEDMRPTIYTTNLTPSEVKGALGDRVASRLAETCIRVALGGPDRRRQFAA